MSATSLPSSGASPLDGPKTCDASGMIEIHRLFRHSFDEAPGLVDGVAAATPTTRTRSASSSP